MANNNTNSIQTIKDLQYYLKVAMQLEHATIPPYLIALYSIKPNTNLAATDIIRTVVVEEMLHLTLASNLLNAVGGEPDLSSQGFVARYPAHLPDGEEDFEVNRAAFSLETLEIFLKIERPAKENKRNLEINRVTGRKNSIINSQGSSEPDLENNKEDIPVLNYYSIGEFYDAIIGGFHFLNKKYPNELFIGNPDKQITSEYYYSGGGNIIPVYDLHSAINAINEIIEQGEGARNSIDDKGKEIAHYYRFEQLKIGRYYNQGDQPGAPSGEPLVMDWSAIYPLKTNVVQTDYPLGSEIAIASKQFNDFYGEFLTELTKAFNDEPKLLVPAVGKMFHIKDLIHTMVRNPIPGIEKYNGAPTFEVNLANHIGVQPNTVQTGYASSMPEPSLFNTFIALSVSLTGFPEYQLQGTGLASLYLSELIDIVGKEIIQEILDTYQKIQSKSGNDAQKLEENIRIQLMSDAKFGPVARNILKLWYSGNWYQLPDEWRTNYGVRERDISFVISAESYTEGLLWRAIGSNPSGAKPIGYGIWAEAPEIS
jgi:hypothetical protein